MPNCRRRFATENEVTKHIDNHMNPNTAKARRTNNNTNSNNHASSAAAAAANHLMDSKNAAAAQFLNNNNGPPGSDNKSNIIPRVGMSATNGPQQQQQSVVKNELYFPQCYGPPFQQSFQPQGQPSAAHTNGVASTQPPVTVTVSNAPPGVVVQQPTSVVAQ